jgi:hypothetical protein
MEVAKFKIDEAFNITGRGIVLTGDIESGEINSGDYIELGYNSILITGIEGFRKIDGSKPHRVGLLLRTGAEMKKEDFEIYYNITASITSRESLLPPAINLEEIQYKYSAFNKDKSEQHKKYLQEESLKAQLFCNSVIGMRPDIGFYVEVNGISISKDVFPKEYEQIIKAWSKVHEKLNEFKKDKNDAK